MKLRQHQKDCIDTIDKHFKTDNNALIKMFCGSGKSFIIFDSLLRYCVKLGIVVVPSINLITQFNRDYFLNDELIKYNKKNFDKKFELMTICSKNELDTSSQKKFEFTTNKDDILEFLENDKSEKIILVTYQSLEVLFTIIKDNLMTVDILCFDEAHHILGDGMKKLLFGFDNDDYDDEYDDDYNENFIDTYIKKTLYFTATPKNSNGIKMYEPVTEITINDVDYDIVDDEDTYYQEDTHCGKMIFEYMHKNGVVDNILNDFNVRVDLYSENTNDSIFEAISRTILETGNNRVLTFHSRSVTKSNKGSDVLSFSDEINKTKFIKCFNKIVKTEFSDKKHKYKNIEFVGITANTKNKMDILNQFDLSKDDDIFILASCKTIGEGVDTKNANMIVFIDPKQSYIEIIQNIGRICRKQNKLSTILIPCYVDVDKYKDCKTIEDKDIVIRNEMSKTGNFNGILNVMSALRQEDPYIFELCLKYPEVYTEKEINDNLKQYGLKCHKELAPNKLFKKHDIKYDDDKSEKKNFRKLSKTINKNIQIINTKILEEDIYIDNEFDETMYLIKKDDKYTVTKGKCNGIVKKCNRNVKPFVHTDDKIKVLWEIESDIDCNKKIFGGYIKSVVVGNNTDNWMIMLRKVTEYIDKYGKRPCQRDKYKEIRQICEWISTQQKNYAKKQKIMKKKM